jgi:hypothetical protein
MANDLTADQFWSDLIAAHKLETPPPGALCVSEFAQRIGKSERQARLILSRLIAAGAMTCGEFAKPDGSRAAYYWRKE